MNLTNLESALNNSNFKEQVYSSLDEHFQAIVYEILK